MFLRGACIGVRVCVKVNKEMQIRTFCFFWIQHVAIRLDAVVCGDVFVRTYVN